jgi:uncharacterized membrane protein YuzA (DUF378 family)
MLKFYNLREISAVKEVFLIEAGINLGLIFVACFNVITPLQPK